jgi:hypothetical protein
MKLLSLEVERFRCIRKAQIEFAPGLNVLHGPNDLGKSSLVHAIRAALLLQSNAKEGEAFASWHEEGEPVVELVFESEPQRIWRVKKTFGTGNARLQFSKDGVDFSHEARAREVDERLSEILRWGVAPPGGKGRPKGMPETFLTAALLPDQDRVDAIFHQALGEDSDESGRKWLTSALQAMAEDPIFKSVLERVQERVDEAFNISEKGVKKKGGKQSLWKKLTDEINEKQERKEERQRELQKTNAIEGEIRILRERRVELKEAAVKAEGRRVAALENLEKMKRREEIAVRLEGQKSSLCAITTELQQLREAEVAHRNEFRRIGELAKNCEEAQTARDKASKQAEKAKEELTRAQSADRARERQLEQTTLEAQRDRLGVEQSKLETLAASARAIESAEARASTLEFQLQGIEKSAAAMRGKAEATAGERADLERDDRDLRAVRAFFQWQTAREAFEEAEKGAAQLADLSKQAREKRTAAASLEAAQSGVALPSQEQIDTLRMLESDIRVVAVEVNVGLSVTVRPKRALRVEIQRDGEPRTSHDLNASPLDTAARRQLQVDIDGIAEIAVSGGAADARERMEALERRWATEAAPLLQQTGVPTVEELARMSVDAGKRAAEIESAVRDAAQLEQRMADQPEWGKLVPDRQSAVRAAEKALMGAEPSELEKMARKLRIRDAVDAEKGIDRLHTRFAKLGEDARQSETQLAAEEARAAEKGKSLEEARGDRKGKQATIEGEWREVLVAAAKRQAEIQKDLETIEGKLAHLTQAGDEDLTAARASAEKAAEAHEKFTSAYQAAQEELNKAKLAHATNEGTLKARREAADKLNETGAREAMVGIEDELRAAPLPSEQVTAETLAEAERLLHLADTKVDDIDGEIREKQGALQQVGGAVAKQRAEDAAIELDLARERLNQTELEYGAWELLRTTMREAEQEEGTNLGRALTAPITQRFEALTGGRYGKFILGAELETEGISTAGQARDIGQLSVGTRDQLSTIFRLTLAEQLKTAVILDDQLAQSDAKRMSWLKGLLQEIAANVQVIVLTCRPGDYVDALPARKGSKRLEAQTPVHAIDLLRFIERSQPAGV